VLKGHVWSRAIPFACFLVLMAVPSAVAAPASPAGLSLDALVDRQVETLDTQRLEQLFGELEPPAGSLLPDFSLRTVVDYLTGRKAFPSITSFFGELARLGFAELFRHSVLLGKLVSLAVLAALLRNIQSAFENDAVGRVAYSVVYLALAILAVTSFNEALGLARGIVESLVHFMLALVPLIVTLLAGTGALVSAGLFQPLIFIVIGLVSTITADVVMPLLFLAAVVLIVDRFHEGIHVSGLASLIQQASLTVMGLAMSLLLGVVAVQGAAAAAVDGVTLRSAKFASKAFVPVFGSIFSDAMELVASSSLFLKNATSIYGLVGVFVMTVYPVVKLLALVVVYKLAAALIEPIDEGATVGLLSSMAGSLTLLTVCAGAVMIMFFVVLTIVAGLGNAVAMFR